MFRSACSFIHSDDWRPTQQTLITRFRQLCPTEPYRTINQDYGSFYHRPTPTLCYPDRLKAKVARRHDRFVSWALKQRCQQIRSDEPMPKEFLLGRFEENDQRSSLISQIFERVKNRLDPADVSVTFQCISVLVHDLLCCNPFLPANAVIDQVLRIIAGQTSCTAAVHPPSSALFPLSAEENVGGFCC